ncbi:MAG: S41 family peptidase [Armatimonadota bacterium]
MRSPLVTRRFVPALLAAASAVLAIAPPARADLDAATRTKLFETVWKRVRDTHYDPTFGGLDWDKVRATYGPKIRAAKSDSATFALLRAMIGELKLSHFEIIPADTTVDSGRSHGDGDPGLTISLIEGKAVITAVEEGSPAATAGVKPGSVVVAIDDRKLAPMLSRIHARKTKPAREQVEVRGMTRSLLSGAVGKPVKLELEGGQTSFVDRRAPKGERSGVGNLEGVPAFVESRVLPGGWGYLRFNVFLVDPSMALIRSAIEGFAAVPGLIIDLRGNPGGVGGMAPGIVGMLTPKGRDDRNLGTMKMRGGEIKFAINPQPPYYSGPVAVLVDEMSLSTSEILAGGLQESGRAVVVGRATGGMVLPSNIEKLPGGALFQYAVADFRTPKGVLLEGRGVLPDIPVSLTRSRLSAGGDPILEAAVAALQSKVPTR